MSHEQEQEQREGGLVPAGVGQALSPRHVDMARRGLELARSLDGSDVAIGLRARTVQFPNDRSMGDLDIFDPRAGFPEKSCQACGTVAVPAGKSLWLWVSEQACRDLSPLLALKPDDVQNLDLSMSWLTDDQLSHLRGLTGLRWLDLIGTQITDAGLAHFEGLTNLLYLCLDLRNTLVTDVGVAKLRAALPHLVIFR